MNTKILYISLSFALSPMALLAQNVVNDSTAEGIVNVAFGKVSKGDSEVSTKLK